MSFVGSINAKLRAFFQTHARCLEGRDIYVGCSGNFTVEQIISRQCKEARIYSNDVSLYSSALGHYLAGKPFDLQVVNDEIRWAQEYIRRGPAETVAVLLIFMSMFKFEKRNNPYAIRMWQTYEINFERIFADTVKKIKAAAESIRIADYTMTDVHDFYPRPDGVSIGFLPTYVGGYEKLFKRLDESVQWDRPHYELLTTERREETLSRMAQGDYILYDDAERDMPCVARVDAGGRRTVYIYSNIDFSRGLFRRKITEKVKHYDILAPAAGISPGARISVVHADIATVNHYRNMYLSKKIQPGAADLCLMVFADNRLFGVLMFQAYSPRTRPGHIYLMSDFVVPSTRYPRLAKLLLLLSATREVRQIIEERNLKRYEGILTTAFTDKPVSMKYRGVYELLKRGDGFLNYRCSFSDTTLQEALDQWMKKYNKPEKP